jgi:hypothetical protein
VVGGGSDEQWQERGDERDDHCAQHHRGRGAVRELGPESSALRYAGGVSGAERRDGGILSGEGALGVGGGRVVQQRGEGVVVQARAFGGIEKTLDVLALVGVAVHASSFALAFRGVGKGTGVADFIGLCGEDTPTAGRFRVKS